MRAWPSPWARRARCALRRAPSLPSRAPRVVPVDTTGAGDAFNGALCAALLADAPFPQAVSLAVRAASLSVAQPRAVASFPTREALEASVRSAPGREK